LYLKAVLESRELHAVEQRRPQSCHYPDIVPRWRIDPTRLACFFLTVYVEVSYSLRRRTFSLQAFGQSAFCLHGCVKYLFFSAEYIERT
jgi:hypothetical protein